MSSDSGRKTGEASAPKKTIGATAFDVLGDYRIVQQLGAGGMGCVYLATDEQLHRTVALKVLQQDFVGNDEARERFFREARAAAALKHDNIVTIYQVGEDQGIVYLAMEHLEGKSLEDWLRPDRRASLSQTLSIGKQIARALGAAHRAGVIHRDIKPDNIWLEPNGRIKILDFGIAQHATAANTKLTHTGSVMGTPAFMSPEQARGEPVDHRTDLFSFGCVLYRMVTGRLPFQAEGAYGVIAAILSEQQVPAHTLNPAVPEPLSDFIDHLLNKSRDDRPSSAQEALQQLKVLESQPTQALTGDPTISLPKIQKVAFPQSSQVWWRRWGILALPLVILLLGTSAWFIMRDSGDAEETASLQEQETKDSPTQIPATEPTDNPENAVKLGEEIDLLAKVDTSHPIRGIWTRTGDAIVGRQPISKPRPLAFFSVELPVPQPIPEEYCLKMRVERISNESGPLIIRLSAQSTPFSVGIDTTFPERKGLYTGIYFQRSLRRGGVLVPRIPVDLAFWVTKDRLRVTANEKDIYTWTGDFTQLHALGKTDVPFELAGRHPAIFRFSKVQLIPYLPRPDESKEDSN